MSARQRIALTGAALAALMTAGAQAQVTVRISPTSATLRGNETRQFTATVTGTTNLNVTWQVNGVTGGNAATGMISATGLYVAPAVAPSPNQVTVRAVSVADSTKTASATVTINNPTPTITSTAPNPVLLGPATITVNGTGFTPGTTATFHGAAATVTYVSPVQIQIAVTVTEAMLGDAVLRVSNPAPGATNSLPVLVTVRSFPGEPKMTAINAARFLRRTSFGPSPKDIDYLMKVGIEQYLNEQFAAANPTPFPAMQLTQPLEYAQEQWFRNALTGDDQLRQRVAFALHKIMVVSGVEVDCAEAYIPYYRIFLDRAFGNFFDLMKDITLNVAMGEYLDMVNNKKATAAGDMPNENYARELLQLFTIGLVELEPNGNAKLDAFGKPIPTYDQDTVLALSRVFTGWTYPDKIAGDPTKLNPPAYHAPMEPVQSLHDTGEKVLWPNVILPPNQTARKDLDDALRIIFNHPNVGPFIGKQLIEHLVTSNPSPGYVQRVTNVFNNNGSGVRGDLRAVVRAILLDPEAFYINNNFGKMKEPALFMTGLIRALGITVTDTPFMADLGAEMSQRVFYPPSVFSYFSPAFRNSAGQTAPEFQIFTTATALTRANFAYRTLYNSFGSSMTFNLTPWSQLAAAPDLLVERVNQVLMGGTMIYPMKTVLLNAVNAQSSNNEKARTALHLTAASMQHSIDR
jgi:uncharacterized protein (DUF1800 family)